MINLNSNLVSGRTLSGAAAAGVTKVTEDISEQVHESPTYFGTAKLNRAIMYSMIWLRDIVRRKRLLQEE